MDVSLKDLAFVHLLTELTLYARDNQSGTVLPRTLVYTEEKEVAVIPDIVFVKRARSGIIQKNRICGVPDLVVEIVSNPSHRDKLLGKKKDTYARCEVPEYWVADPSEKAVRKYVLDGGVYQETKKSRLFPDLQVQLLDPLKRVEGGTGMNRDGVIKRELLKHKIMAREALKIIIMNRVVHAKD